MKEALLNALHEYHAPKSEREQLKKQLHQTHILYDKGFVEECYKILGQIKKQAIKRNDYDMILGALYGEMTVKRPNEIDVDAIYKEQCHYLKLMECNQALEYIHLKIYKLHYKLYNVRDEKHLEELEELMHHPVLQNEENASTYHTKMLFYDIHMLYHMLTNKPLKSHVYLEKLVNLCETHPDSDPYNYYCVLGNYVGNAATLGLFDDAFEGLSKIKKLYEEGYLKQYKHLAGKTFFYDWHVNYLNILNDAKRFDDALAFLPEFERELPKYFEQMEHKFQISTLAIIGYTYFVTEHYENALEWYGKARQLKNEETLSDLKSLLGMFSLLAHYELGNHDYLESAIRSTHRNLKKHDRLYKTETALIKALRAALYAKNKREEKSIFINLREQLVQYEWDEFEASFHQRFQLGKWCDAKIARQSFRHFLEKEAVFQRA